MSQKENGTAEDKGGASFNPTSIPIVIVEPESSRRIFLVGLFQDATSVPSLSDIFFGEPMILILGPTIAENNAILDEAETVLVTQPLVASILITDGSEVSIEKMQWGFRANAKGVLPFQSDAETIRQTVRRAQNILATSVLRPEKTSSLMGEVGGGGGAGKIISVFSPKGGVGTTTIATNLAVSIAKKLSDVTVAILDADLQFGDIALSLNIRKFEHNIATILNSKDRVNPNTYDYACSTFKNTNLRVLPAPPDPTQAEMVDSEGVQDMLFAMRHFADFTIVDTACIIDETSLTVLENSDLIIVPVISDLITAKNVAIALRTFKALGIAKSKIALAVNRQHPEAHGNIKEIEKTLDHEVAVVLPEDDKMKELAYETIPIVIYDAKSPLSHSIASFVDKKIIGEKSVKKDAGEQTRKTLKKRKIFGK